MPQTPRAPSIARSTAAPSGLPPVPVGIFLPTSRPTSHPTPGTESVVVPVADTTGYPEWCGVPARDVARLIATYAAAGNLVGDLDGHPTIINAARYFDCRPVRLPGDGGRGEQAATRARRVGRCRVALILAALPHAGTGNFDTDSPDVSDLAGTTHAMHAWRALLRPDGYLLVALSPPDVRDDLADERVSYRATVIAAARTAGLSWQQELLVVTAPLAEYEPRAMPDTAAATSAALVHGRHQPAHIKILAFQRRAGGTDA